nr:hypothetical protein [Tanacetum cinerariifolium]
MGEPIKGLTEVGDNFPDICEDDLLDIIKDETSMPHMKKNDTTRGVSKCGVGKWVEMQKLFFEGSPRSSVDLKRAAKSAHGKVKVRWDSPHTSILKQTTPSGTIYLMMKESCCRYSANVTEGHYYEYLIPLNEESLGT